jgi:hypothetical protein
MYPWTVELERSRIWLLKDFFWQNPVRGAFGRQRADVVSGRLGGAKLEDGRYSPSRWSEKVARRAGDLLGSLMDQTPVFSSFAPPKRPEPTLI